MSIQQSRSVVVIPALRCRSGKALGWSEQRKSWTHSVFFGWNAAVQQQGRIAVGDAVQVIEAQA